MSDLRDLASQLMEVTRRHPCASQGLPIVQQCADYLCCIAFGFEANRRLFEASAEMETLRVTIRNWEDASRHPKG